LSVILQHVGFVVRLDQNTLLRLKGKFARVCVNIDIAKPLSGSITVQSLGGGLCIPIIYECLHEVCPLCGVNLTNYKLALNYPLPKGGSFSGKI